MTLRGGHYFASGQELALILIRRFVSLDSLSHLASELGRSEAAISEASAFMMHHLHSRFEHCFNEQSFYLWMHRFQEMADAFAVLEMPVPDLILLIDGKLYETCRPTRGQRDVYDGHHKQHGVSGQGHVYPNGIIPYAYFEPHGRHHDSYNLQQSGVLEILADICSRLGKDYRAGADSGYPVHRYLTPMFRAAVATRVQALFNRAYSPGRVTVEWGFQKIVALYPYINHYPKLKLLRQDVGLMLPIALFLTNCHTCLMGDALSDVTGMDAPSLEDWLSGQF